MVEIVAATLKMPNLTLCLWQILIRRCETFQHGQLLEQPAEIRTYSARSWIWAKKTSSPFSSPSQLEHCIPIFVGVYYSLLVIQDLLKNNICLPETLISSRLLKFLGANYPGLLNQKNVTLLNLVEHFLQWLLNRKLFPFPHLVWLQLPASVQKQHRKC